MWYTSNCALKPSTTCNPNLPSVPNPQNSIDPEVSVFEAAGIQLITRCWVMVQIPQCQCNMLGWILWPLENTQWQTDSSGWHPSKETYFSELVFCCFPLNNLGGQVSEQRVPKKVHYYLWSGLPCSTWRAFMCLCPLFWEQASSAHEGPSLTAIKACSQNRGHWHMKALHVLHVKPLHRKGTFFWETLFKQEVRSLTWHDWCRNKRKEKSKQGILWRSTPVNG